MSDSVSFSSSIAGFDLVVLALALHLHHVHSRYEGPQAAGQFLARLNYRMNNQGAYKLGGSQSQPMRGDESESPAPVVASTTLQEEPPSEAQAPEAVTRIVSFSSPTPATVAGSLGGADEESTASIEEQLASILETNSNDVDPQESRKKIRKTLRKKFGWWVDAERLEALDVDGLREVAANILLDWQEEVKVAEHSDDHVFLQDVSGDGDCLFTVLGKQLLARGLCSRDSCSARNVRTKIVEDGLCNEEKMKNRPWDIILGDAGKATKEDYQAYMKQEGNWGGDVELGLAAEIYNVRVEVWKLVHDRYPGPGEHVLPGPEPAFRMVNAYYGRADEGMDPTAGSGSATCDEGRTDPTTGSGNATCDEGTHLIAASAGSAACDEEGRDPIAGSSNAATCDEGRTDPTVVPETSGATFAQREELRAPASRTLRVFHVGNGDENGHYMSFFDCQQDAAFLSDHAKKLCRRGVEAVDVGSVGGRVVGALPRAGRGTLMPMAYYPLESQVFFPIYSIW